MSIPEWAGVRRGPRSRDVYAWLRADPSLVTEATAKLDRRLAEWDQLCRDIDACGVVGRFAGDSESPDDPASGVRAALVEASAALSQLYDEVCRHTPALARGAELLGRAHALAELADADGTCRRRLEAAAAGLPCDGTRPWLPRPPTAGDAPDLAGRAMALRDDPEALRRLLGDERADVVADLLARLPILAHTLSEPTTSGPPLPGPIGGSARDNGADDTVGDSVDDTVGDSVDDSVDDAEGDSLRRVVRVREALAGMDPDMVRRWGLLWPHTMGPLNGAPLPVRFAANRLLVRHTLADLAGADRRYDAHEAAARGEPGPWLGRLGRRVRRAWAGREALTGLWSPSWVAQTLARADARTRIRLIQSLLHAPSYDAESVAPSASEPGPAGRRQVLLFDPTGRGRLAELVGHIDGSTRHVAVFVPGTGTAMRGFHLPVRFAADLVAADPGGTTAALAWMGCELPLAYGTESPLARFASAGARPLRDVVEALGLPKGADVTVIGHSYGGVIVGAAERAGLRVDRVVHLASPGAGPGVRGAQDYPDQDPLGRPRAVRRWALIAPGDPVNWARRVDRVRRSARGLPAPPALDLGIDPTRLAGVQRLEAGVWDVDSGRFRTGTPVAGFAAHTAVTNPRTTAFRRVAEVVRGEFDSRVAAPERSLAESGPDGWAEHPP